MRRARQTKYSTLELYTALQKSLELQAHYAKLLNGYDSGRRVAFKTVDEWLARLRELSET